MKIITPIRILKMDYEHDKKGSYVSGYAKKLADYLIDNADYERFVRFGSIKSKPEPHLFNFLYNQLIQSCAHTALTSKAIQFGTPQEKAKIIFQDSMLLNYIFCTGGKSGEIKSEIYKKSDISQKSNDIYLNYKDYDWIHGLSATIFKKNLGDRHYVFILIVTIYDLKNDKLLAMGISDKIPLINGHLNFLDEIVKIIVKLIRNLQQNPRRGYILSNFESHFPEDIDFLIFAIRNKKLEEKIKQSSLSEMYKMNIPKMLFYNLPIKLETEDSNLDWSFEQQGNHYDYKVHFGLKINYDQKVYNVSFRADNRHEEPLHIDIEINNSAKLISHYHTKWEDILDTGLFNLFSSKLITDSFFSKIILIDQDYLLKKKRVILEYYTYRKNKLLKKQSAREICITSQTGEFGFPCAPPFCSLCDFLSGKKDDLIERYNEIIFNQISKLDKKQMIKSFRILDQHIENLGERLLSQMEDNGCHYTAFLNLIEEEYNKTINKLDNLIKSG